MSYIFCVNGVNRPIDNVREPVPGVPGRRACRGFPHDGVPGDQQRAERQSRQTRRGRSSQLRVK